MILYFVLCFVDFLPFVLKSLIKDIVISLIITLFVLFFGRVVFEDSSPFLIYWKWSYIAVLTIGSIQYIIKVWNTWPIIKELSLKWNLSIKQTYAGLVRKKLFKKYNIEEILEWNRDEFIMNKALPK